ncbi:hypothetical protein [Bradyrhizobium sp. P5_C11_2]
MKFNRGGLICVGLYTCYILFMLAAAYLAPNDKTRGCSWGSVVFLAGSSLQRCPKPRSSSCRLTPILSLLNLVTIEVGIYLLSFAIAYLSGWAFEKIILSIAPWLNRLDDRWFDRVHRDDR